MWMREKVATIIVSYHCKKKNQETELVFYFTLTTYPMVRRLLIQKFPNISITRRQKLCPVGILPYSVEHMNFIRELCWELKSFDSSVSSNAQIKRHLTSCKVKLALFQLKLLKCGKKAPQESLVGLSTLQVVQ